MRITIKLFATLREAAGQRLLVEEVPDGSSLGDVVRRICGRLGPEFRKQVLDEHGEPLERVRILLNGHNAIFLGGFAARLKDGDEIAMFPPVGGGL
ncbi:MAG: MoaD family protein [Hadesarchaea archaeon]|nr:MoaD family protein [Hadesarchaea archaeon]